MQEETGYTTSDVKALLLLHKYSGPNETLNLALGELFKDMDKGVLFFEALECQVKVIVSRKKEVDEGELSIFDKALLGLHMRAGKAKDVSQESYGLLNFYLDHFVSIHRVKLDEPLDAIIDRFLAFHKMVRGGELFITYRSLCGG